MLDLVLSLLALNGFQSVKFNYEHFLEQISSYRLKSYYYTLKESKIDLNAWMRRLLQIALGLIPEKYKQPIELSIDDTMVEKYGSHFECRSKLFDHARHNGSSYLNGHCFVCLMLSIPVQNGDSCRYLHIPIGYRMWTKEKSKLEMAAELVQFAMKSIGSEYPVCLCCDSWYPKGAILNLPEQFRNLTLICNVRSDTVLYDLPPERTGKRGRPKLHGEKLTLDDFSLSDIPDTEYRVGSRFVMTNLFGRRKVFAIVTQLRSGKSKRLFLCSRPPEELVFDLRYLSDSACVFARTDRRLLPLSIYALRWNIEVAFYEQKTFWALEDYMLRSKVGIERLLNLLTLVYSSMILLPHLEPAFSHFKLCSPQQTRFLLGDLVRKQVFLTTFASQLETEKKDLYLANCLRNLASRLLSVA